MRTAEKVAWSLVVTLCFILSFCATLQVHTSKENAQLQRELKESTNARIQGVISIAKCQEELRDVRGR